MNVMEKLNWSRTKGSLASLQDLLKCTICDKSKIVDPVDLPCHHTFCRGCFSSVSPPDVCPKCGAHCPRGEMKQNRMIDDLASAAEDLLSVINGKDISIPATIIDSTVNSSYNSHMAEIARQQMNIPPAKPKINTTAISKKKSTNKLQKLQMNNKISPPKEIEKSKACKNGVAPPFTPPVDAIPSAPIITKKVLLSPAIVKKNYRNTAPSTPTSGNTSLLALPPSTPKVDKRNSKGETTLQVASVKGDLDTVCRLLSDGANPNTRDHAGWTPLHEACQYGHVKVAEQLIRAGALIDVPSWQGNTTPLHDAVEHGMDSIVVLLRKYGADVTVRDMMGKTPEDIARLCTGSEELLSALSTLPDNSLIRGVTPTIPISSRSPVLTGSNLTPELSSKLSQLVKMLRLKLVMEFSSEVTHVIVQCKTDDNVCLKRTGKLLMGIASGKWILSHKYIDACLSSNCLVEAKPFEVTGSNHNATSEAPSKARVNAEKMLPGLLSGCNVFLHGNFDAPPRKELEGLIKAGGGKLLLREPHPEKIPPSERTVPYHASENSLLRNCSHYIIYQEGKDSEPQVKYDMTHIKSLPLLWLNDCIDHFTLLPPLNSYDSQSY